MTQTASNPRLQLAVSLPAGGALAQPSVPANVDAAGGLGSALDGRVLVPHLDPRAAIAAGGEDDVLAEVWRTSSYLESKQWELDGAHEALRQAVQKASSAGVADDELSAAANLTAEELAAMLPGSAAQTAI